MSGGGNPPPCGLPGSEGGAPPGPGRFGIAGAGRFAEGTGGGTLEVLDAPIELIDPIDPIEPMDDPMEPPDPWDGNPRLGPPGDGGESLRVAKHQTRNTQGGGWTRPDKQQSLLFFQIKPTPIENLKEKFLRN